jgi:hypothetical protein
MSTIIVGSNNIKTAEYYQKLGLDPSMLVTGINHSYPVGHTCIQDIPDYSQLEIVLKNADAVYWAESSKHEFHNEDSYYNFLNWLKDYNLKYRNVKNFESIKFDNYGWLTTKNTEPNQAVFLGCSFTAGSGLSDPNTHYAAIVAKHFDKQLLNLGVGGSSNNFIFDQFTQLNFHPGQIVVLQFTLLERLRYCNTDRQLSSIQFANLSDSQLSRAMLEVYHKDFLFYELLVKIRAMITIARLQKLKLVFWLIDYKHEDRYSKLDQTYFYDLIEFVPYSWMSDYMVDGAEDNLHPGIESNKNIARALINYIETIYEC